MNLLTVPVITLLLILGLLLTAAVGSLTSERRQATAAADAAALAAAGVWDEHLGRLFGSESGVGLWGLVGVPVLGDGAYHAMRAAAADYAERNDADLIDFRVDTWARDVYVEVRHRRPVLGTDQRLETAATAHIELTGGLCSVGGAIGVLDDGWCRREVPPPIMVRPEPLPEPADEPECEPLDLPGRDREDEPECEPRDHPEPQPTPSQAPPQASPYESRIVLVG